MLACIVLVYTSDLSISASTRERKIGFSFACFLLDSGQVTYMDKLNQPLGQLMS